ncbi:MAG: hypothetical protein K9L86_04000 [Candidatus Omnitrophica bacterium]|nr:hypothetical protein [Candidatus Omnitrophota bacterium]
MIAIVISITVSLSILLSAFVSFSPSFKAIVEGEIKRKAQESAWVYASKSGQLIERANSDGNPPDNFTCVTAASAWNCMGTVPMREEESGGVWTDTEHVCIEVSRSAPAFPDLPKITVENVTSSSQTCPHH